MLALYRNIKDRRLELNLTQTDLAKRTGYSDKSMIAKIEAGKVDLPLSKIEIFAEALEISPSELMGETWENDVLSNARLDIVDNLCGDAFEIAKFQAIEREDVKSEQALDTVNTIAAHHDGEEWTAEELDEIEEFKKFVLSKRNKK